VFAAMPASAVSDPTAMAGGISMALVNTAGGIVVAIPAIIMHRFFKRHIASLAVEMEQQAIKLVDIVHGDREVEEGEAPARSAPRKDGGNKKEKVA
jgi:biopolymer transport protein ExbB